MQDFLQIAERGLHEGRPSLARKLDRTKRSQSLSPVAGGKRARS
jgi:hypothetical protein